MRVPSISMKMQQVLFTLLLAVQASFAYEEDDLIHVQTFDGKVGSDNFTYYSLKLAGCVIIRLESLVGDADIYGSSSTMQPTWELYDFKSVTCGVDEIMIEPKLTRPIGIGVYGYITEETNHFRLSVYIDSNYAEPYPETEQKDGKWTVEPDSKNPMTSNEETEEESILWTIFVGFLKILFDVLI